MTCRGGQGAGSPFARLFELWVFYPGQAGAQFMQQYAQAELKDSIPICSVFTVDALTLPQIKEQALGQMHQVPSRAMPQRSMS